MKAPALLELAKVWLAGRYPEALLVPELSIGTWGKALLDLAAITETEIIGVEIKGEGDSPSRLGLQAAVYSKAATRMFILPAPSLERLCFRHVPDCWGRLRVNETGQVERARRHEWDRDAEPEVLSTAPRQLLQCLWKDELRDIARRHGVFTERRPTAINLLDCLAEDLPLKVLRLEVCRALRERKWINKAFEWAVFVNERELARPPLGSAA